MTTLRTDRRRPVLPATRRYPPAHFPAPVSRSYAAGGFVLSETRYAGGATLGTHAHQNACLVVVLEGCFEDLLKSDARAAAPGTVIIRPEGEPHSNRFSRAGACCLNVELPPPWLARTRLMVRSAALRGDPFALLGRRLHLELVDGDDLSALAVESLVLEIIEGFGREERLPGSAPLWLLRVKDRIHADPAARASLADLGAAAGVHPVHLAASFRRFFGRSVAATIRRLRLELACRELSSSDAPIADVAIAAGFADQSHLGRAFKKAMRLTPAAYRAASRSVASP